jgi:hypothetical protein
MNTITSSVWMKKRDVMERIELILLILNVSGKTSDGKGRGSRSMKKLRQRNRKR